jgi:hypothetical protein
MPRITKVDLTEINRALGHIDELKKQFGTLQLALSSVKQQVTHLDVIHAPATSNTLVFTWTGSTLTLSWPAGSIANKNSVNTPVAAGHIANLLASTYYWLAWNAEHQQMVANTDANILFQNSGNLVICKLFTGTAGQTGVAGGGGSSSAKSDLSGFQYKLF